MIEILHEVGTTVTTDPIAAVIFGLCCAAGLTIARAFKVI